MTRPRSIFANSRYPPPATPLATRYSLLARRGRALPLMSRVPVVPAFGPVVRGPDVGVADRADALDVLHPGRDREGQAQRRTVTPGERLVVHGVGQKSLRMNGALHIKPDV